MILANTHTTITKHLLFTRFCSGVDVCTSMCTYAVILTATPELDNIIIPSLQMRKLRLRDEK